jgi:hypothetical protein
MAIVQLKDTVEDAKDSLAENDSFTGTLVLARGVDTARLRGVGSSVETCKSPIGGE